MWSDNLPTEYLIKLFKRDVKWLLRTRLFYWQNIKSITKDGYVILKRIVIHSLSIDKNNL